MLVAYPFTINSEPLVEAVNNVTIVDELYKAEAMNQQTKMVNLTDAPPPLSNLMYLYGNRNGVLKYQMRIAIDFAGLNYPWVEISVMENAATNGGANGVVEAYRIEKAANFTGVNTLYLFFDNFFGPVNIGIRAENTAIASSIMELRCIILNAEER